MTVSAVILVGISMFKSDSGNIKNEINSEITNFKELEEVIDISKHGALNSSEILQKTMWDILEKRIDEQMKQKFGDFDLSKYQVISVETTYLTDIYPVISGLVDVVMLNKESKMYDWLTISITLYEGLLLEAKLVETNYYSIFDKNIEILETDEKELVEFLRTVFENKLLPSNFGYRYRMSMDNTLEELTLIDTDILGKGENDTYFVRAEYLINQKHIQSVMVIKKYNGHKLQIEDIKTNEIVPFNLEGDTND